MKHVYSTLLTLALSWTLGPASSWAVCDAKTRAQICGKISGRHLKAMSTGDLIMMKFHKKDCGCPAKDPYASNWGSYDAPRDERGAASAGLETEDKKPSLDDLSMIQERIRNERPKRVSPKERNRQLEADFQSEFGVLPEMRPGSMQPSFLVRENASKDKAPQRDGGAHQDALARLLAAGICFSNDWITLSSGKALVDRLLAPNGAKELGERVENLSQGRRTLGVAPRNGKIFALPANADNIQNSELWLLEASNPKLALFMASKADTVYLNCLDLDTDGDKVRKLMVKKENRQSELAAQERRDQERAQRKCEAECAHFENHRCYSIGPDNASDCQEAKARLGNCACDMRQARQAANCAPSCAQLDRCADSEQRENQLLLGLLPESLDKLCRAAAGSVNGNACACETN